MAATVWSQPGRPPTSKPSPRGYATSATNHTCLYATRKTKDLKQVLTFLADPPADGPPLLVVATDKYVGEGYDCPKLDVEHQDYG